jgi:outer membrane protein assembly factor BamB
LELHHNGIYKLTVANKTVYFTGRISDFDNYDRLYALDADSGAQKWMFYGSGVIKWYSLADNIMYVAVAHTPIGSTFYLCALDTPTGHQIWKQTFAWGDDGPPSFIVDGGLIYFSHSPILDGEDEYYAINGTDGTTFWKTNLSEGNFGPSALVDGLICFSTRDAVYAINATNGAIVWTVPKEQGYFFYPTFSFNGDIVYALGYREHEIPTDKTYPKIYAQNARDGSTLWNYSVGENYLTGLAGDIYDSLDITDDTLYLLVDYSSLSAVDGVSGQQVWNHSGRPYSIDNGIAYFYEDTYDQKQTNLEAIDSSNGNSLWNYSSTLNFINAQNNVIFFQQSNTLYALNIEDNADINDNPATVNTMVVFTVVFIAALLIAIIALVSKRKINRRL